jgi:hypothetical protein
MRPEVSPENHDSRGAARSVVAGARGGTHNTTCSAASRGAASVNADRGVRDTVRNRPD